MKKTWSCTCNLCKGAFQEQLEVYEWVDFVRHRENVVIELDANDRKLVYITEMEGGLLFTTEYMDVYKTLKETWEEEVILCDHMKKCEIKVYEDGGTPFDRLIRKKLSA